jgi:hypothetical protein
MESKNISKITGDDNKVIQGLTAGRDIIITISDDLPPEVKEQKRVLGVRIEELVAELSKLMKLSKGNKTLPDTTAGTVNPVYKKIKWRRLIQAIKHQGCILFVGPEISADERGVSLHQSFYRKLASELDDIEYMEEEGFFSPGAEEEILYDVLDYYRDEFHMQNNIGRNILEKLAQFPFTLTISLCPDDTIHQIYNDFDLNHQFLYYDGTKKEIDLPKGENPLIYNILGNASENGRYVFTHENLYNYLNDITIPPVIKKKIQDATHFLFIGFDFSKWYNRLLLFVLDFDHSQTDANRLNIEKNTIAKEFEKFIQKQFDITSVHDDYEEFIGCLVKHAREEEGIIKDLSSSFIQTNFRSLQKLSIKVTDEKKLKTLLKINEETDLISKKIKSFKQLIS